jgi:hypothetical protein
MLRLLAVLAVASALLFGARSSGIASEIEVTLRPVRAFSALGEPVAVRMILRNSSEQALQLCLGYPRDLGLQFSCADSDAVARAGELMVVRAIPTVELSPGERYEVVFALDRYLSMRKAKRYLVEYKWLGYEFRHGEKPSLTTHTATGDFTFGLHAEPPPRDLIPELRKQLGSNEKQKQREAVELLLWIDDPGAIDALVMAAGAVPRSVLPSVGPDIVDALRKFAAADKGRSAVISVARVGDCDTLRAALGACADLDIPVPDDVYESALSDGTGKRYVALEHLLKHGSANQLPFVRPLQKDTNQTIAKMAEEFVAKFEARP